MTTPTPADRAADRTPSSDTLWTAAPGPEYPNLEGDRSVDVAIVGGGIVGLTAARWIQERGQSVAVIESRRIGRQVTGGSSAKITSQHFLNYQHLVHAFGEDTASAYGAANQWAIEEIARTVEALGIDCAFERRPAYTYTVDAARLDELREEAAVAARLGLPAHFTTDVPLPVAAVGAVVFDHQAQFDPYPYLLAVAADVVRLGGAIFERTRVQDVKEDAEGAGIRVITDRGTVTARNVVVATNLPIIDRGGYYMRAFPMAHLVLTARMPSDAPDGMFIAVDEPTHSMRWTRRADGLWLVLTGPRFRPGEIDTTEGFDQLEAFARAHFPIGPVEYRWWNEDYYSADRLPFIGRMDNETEHIFIATGFSGWGITNGVVAARILADAIAGETNAWAPVFESTRSALAHGSVGSIVEVLKENTEVITAYVVDRLKPGDHLDVTTIAPGEGRIVSLDHEKVAISRDAAGQLHAVSPICTHLGCVVSWNTAMQTWDCGCHGSCFAPGGLVLRGPAMFDLESKLALIEGMRGAETGHPAT